MSIPLARSTIAFTHTIVRSSICKVWEDSTMSHAKQPSKRMHRACAVPLLGAAGLSLSLASGASALPGGLTADMPTQKNTGASHEVTLGEEEISDVSLATFYVFDKENASSGVQLVGHRGCGGCHGCRGCHRGCGGCRGFGGCRGCWGCGGCGGCIGPWWLWWGY